MKTAFGIFLLTGFSLAQAAPIASRVEIEEDIYTHANANNGAGPMWCSGSTCLVRVGQRLFASGWETVPEALPVNNCRWVLWERQSTGWARVRVDADGRTREPSPLAAFPDGSVLMSINPTLGHGPEPNGGPARPDVLQFRAEDPTAVPKSLGPQWQGAPAFREHSYRSFVADAPNRELLLFQNIDYTHAEWTFRDRTGDWSKQGQLKWPWGAAYDKPQPIRVCYPNVALRDKAVHFFGVSDILEPNLAWREFKEKLTGQHWDYDFRRLFYTWTSDITRKPFADWVEISSREKTCGWVSPGDLWLAPDGDVHLLWSERAIDERLREKFFPGARQSHTLNHAVVREGKVVRRDTVLESTEDKPGIVGSAGRFHVTPDNRLFIVHLASGREADGRSVFENRLIEVLSDGKFGAPIRIAFQKPFTSYFMTTVRAGSAPSWNLELLGLRNGAPGTLSYARVALSH